MVLVSSDGDDLLCLAWQSAQDRKQLQVTMGSFHPIYDFISSVQNGKCYARCKLYQS